MGDSIDQVIINKVLSNSILKKKVDNLNEPGIINLIDPEWSSILNNNPIYQMYKNDAVEYVTKNDTSKHYTLHYIKNRENYFQILVAGYFSVVPVSPKCTSGAIQVRSCKAITEIGNVMSGEHQFCEYCKFFVDNCKGICPSCRAADIPLDNIWCIQNTQVFTKKGIAFAHRKYLEAIFRSSSLAIALIQINTKFNFSNFCKLGGNIKSIIFIQESLLRPDENIQEILTLDSNFVPQRKPDEDDEYDVKTEILKNE